MMDSTFRFLSMWVLCQGLYFSVLYGQGEFHVVSRFGERIGMRGVPTSMVEDKYGFYWVGTRDGLYRLDGTQALEVDIFSPLGKTDTWIDDLSYDASADRLWIATHIGIVSYELGNGKVSPLFLKDSLDIQVSRLSQVAHSVLIDRQGEIWAGLKLDGIIRVSPERDSMVQYRITSAHLSKADPALLSFCNTVVHLVQDPVEDDIIWAGTRHSLIRIHKKRDELRLYEFNGPSPPLKMAANPMRKVYPHKNGRVYVGTWNGGLLEFDPKTATFNQTLLSAPFEENILSNQVTAIYPANDTQLYISGSLGRVFLFDTESRELKLIRENAGVDLIDSKGIIWYLTSDDLRCYHPLRNGISRHFFPKERKVLDLRMAVEERYEEGKIWVRGKMKGGMLQFDRKGGTWRFFTLGDDDQKLVDGNVIHSTPFGVVANDDEDLYIKRPGKEKFERMPFRLDDEGDPFRSVASPSGDIFISGRQGYFYWLHSGLSRMERFTSRETGAPYEGFFSESNVGDMDEFGRVWIHSAGGISLFDPADRSFTHYELHGKNPGADLMIRDLAADDNGKMWCTTVNSVGYFYTSKPEAGIQEIFNVANGYNFTQVWYLVLDEKGRPWIVEREGVVCLDPDAGTVFQTGIYAFSIEKTPDGKILIGGGNSLAMLDPDSLLDNIKEVPQPYVSWIQYGHKKTFIGSDPLTPKEIVIGPDENAFSLAFSAFYLHRPGRVRWSYRLSGLDPDWNFPVNHHTVVHYSGLRPGKYVFQLNATDMFGNARDPYQMVIRVVPPWYRTKVSKALLSVVVLGFIGYLLFSARRRYMLQLSLIRERSESSRLLELDRFKSKVFTNITHELRTPLTLILGLAENLGKARDKKVVDAAARIRENGNNLLEYINQMLDLARLDAGKIDLNPVRNDVVSFIRMTVERFRTMAQAKNIHLGFFPEPENFSFDYDPNYLGQVLSNLLGNAIKFSRTHGEVLVLFRGSESQIEVAVRDSGPGIHPDDLPRIFERFYTADHSLRITEGSTGIGLSLSNELIQLMGGKIEVKSAPGKGSTFRVLLPVLDLPLEGPAELSLKADESLMLSSLGDEDVADPQDTRPLILVIEDNPDLSEYIGTIFDREFRVIMADSGTSGMERAIAELPDVIISDIMMSGIDGIELCQKLKTDMRTSHIPVILLTARVGVESRMEGIRAGAFSFIEKPFLQDELTLHVRNALIFGQRIRDHFLDKYSEGRDAVKISNQESQIVSGERQFLDKVKGIIEDAMSEEDFGIIRLCRALGMSRAQLYRKLRALTGVSVAIYIRNIRLEKAREMLLRTDQNVSQIAYAVGFSDPNYFSKVFHERYGQSPSETRNG